jgi:hypothetical protein
VIPSRPMTWFVRWGIGLVAVLAGVACLILNLGGFGVEELFGFMGAGLSIILINYLFRLGVESDREHEDHEQEWRYSETHGHWPEDVPPEAREPMPERPTPAEPSGPSAPSGPPGPLAPSGPSTERPDPHPAGHRRPGHRPDRPRRRPG